MVLFAVAFSMKPQSSFLFPVIGYVALPPVPVSPARSRSFGAGLVRIVAIGAPGLALWALLGDPVRPEPQGTPRLLLEGVERLQDHDRLGVQRLGR